MTFSGVGIMRECECDVAQGGLVDTGRQVDLAVRGATRKLLASGESTDEG